MKTRLLKKLRRQAEDRYTVEYHKGRYYGYFYEGDFSICYIITKSKDEAISQCDGLRRDYILSRIEEKKKKKIIY